MKVRMNERVGEEIMENLFNQNYPPADAFTVSLRAGQGVLTRGSVLALSSADNTMVLLGTTPSGEETLAANCVLAETIDTGAESGGALAGLGYRTGHFNGNMLTVADGYSFTVSDRESLRNGGILLSDAFAG